jgi:hypothetical protein
VELRSLIVYRLEGVCPTEQIAGVAQELEHAVPRGSDFDALNVERVHRRLLREPHQGFLFL